LDKSQINRRIIAFTAIFTFENLDYEKSPDVGLPVERGYFVGANDG
jgi:hypothetical protein